MISLGQALEVLTGDENKRRRGGWSRGPGLGADRAEIAFVGCYFKITFNSVLNMRVLGPEAEGLVKPKIFDPSKFRWLFIVLLCPCRHTACSHCSNGLCTCL